MGKAVSALRSQEVAMKRAMSTILMIGEVCRRSGLRLVEAYIVGSRARGDYLEDSDIDVVVLVEGVENLNVLQRLEMFRDALEPNIDLFIYSPREWNEGKSLWLRELKREAIKIYPSQ